MHLSTLLLGLPVVMGFPSVKRVESARLLLQEDVSRAISGKYIVKLREHAERSSMETVMSVLPEAPEFVFREVFNGFSATMDNETVQKLLDFPQVWHFLAAHG